MNERIKILQEVIDAHLTKLRYWTAELLKCAEDSKLQGKPPEIYREYMEYFGHHITTHLEGIRLLQDLMNQDLLN